MRPFISPMHEQNRLEPLQMRRVSILRSAGKSSNKPQMSPHEKRLHQIFSSGSIEPLSLTDSDVNQASSSEKGTVALACLKIWSEANHITTKTYLFGHKET